MVKLMKRLLLLLVAFLPLFAVSAAAQNYLTYNSDRRLYWANGAIYTRDDFHWFIENTGQPSRLFLNGVYQSEETGTFDLKMLDAWVIRPNAPGIKVGVVTIPNGHGTQIVALVSLIAPRSVVTLYPISRYYPDVQIVGISNAIAAGSRIIVLDYGSATPDAGISNIIKLNFNVMFVCSLPNTPQDIDLIPDYPTSYNLRNVIGVSACDRNGDPYWSGAGTNTVAAPGRNIAFTDGISYSSGTSYAAPITAGVLALAYSQYNRPAWPMLNLLRSTADNVGGIKRMNPVAFLTANAPVEK